MRKLSLTKSSWFLSAHYNDYELHDNALFKCELHLVKAGYTTKHETEIDFLRVFLSSVGIASEGFSLCQLRNLIIRYWFGSLDDEPEEYSNEPDEYAEDIGPLTDKQIASIIFHASDEWNDLRKTVFKLYGKKCMRCFKEGRTMHVDHVYPRSKFPHMGLSLKNLQVLCKCCNMEKSNKHFTDYRTDEQVEKLYAYLSEKHLSTQNP